MMSMRSLSKLYLLWLLSGILGGCATFSHVPETTAPTMQAAQLPPPLSPYNGKRLRIMVVPWNISKTDLEKYPILQQQRIGFGLSNRLLKALVNSRRFTLVEEKSEIIQRMLQQVKLCKETHCATKYQIDSKLADYVVYPEIYQIGREQTTDVHGVAIKNRETLELGVQLNFIDPHTIESRAIGSYVGRFEHDSEGSIFDEVSRLDFSQSALAKAADQAIIGSLADAVAQLPLVTAANDLVTAANDTKNHPFVIDPTPLKRVEPDRGDKPTKDEEMGTISDNLPTPSSKTTHFQPKGHYFALIIGNNDYAQMPKLKTARADAESIEQLLHEQYGYNTSLLLNGTRQSIIKQLDDLRRKLKQDDNLLIYYAGHGFYDQATERGYWLPVNASTEDTAEWISNADIVDKIKALQSNHILVIADSCFSGSLSRAVSTIDLDREQDTNLHFQRMQQRKSRTVLSSGGIEVVSDNGGSGHSIFAKAFIDTLKDNRNILDGTSFANQVRQRVVVNARQTPEYSVIRDAGHEDGDFLLIRQHLK